MSNNAHVHIGATPEGNIAVVVVVSLPEELEDSSDAQRDGMAVLVAAAALRATLVEDTNLTPEQVDSFITNPANLAPVIDLAGAN